MSGEWLLIETLGEQPAIVAHGTQAKKFVPVPVFLRRNPNLDAILAAIAQTAAGREGLVALNADGSREIRTEAVLMSDGVVHGVHLWYGPAGSEPPERPLPGAYKVDFALRQSTVTPQFLINIGKDPAVEPLSGRSMADDIPGRSFNVDEAAALSIVVGPVAGQTFAANWDFSEDRGSYRVCGFCSRIMTETAEDGSERLIARAMNVLDAVGPSSASADHLAQRLIDGMSRPGSHRAIVDLGNWTLIKWLDEPCPFYDWRGRTQMHPDDHRRFAAEMREELSFDQTSAVVRLPANNGGWTPVHVTVNRIELDKGVFAGLVSLRLPTENEIREAGLTRVEG